MSLLLLILLLFLTGAFLPAGWCQWWRGCYNWCTGCWATGWGTYWGACGVCELLRFWSRNLSLSHSLSLWSISPFFRWWTDSTIKARGWWSSSTISPMFLYLWRSMIPSAAILWTLQEPSNTNNNVCACVHNLPTLRQPSQYQECAPYTACEYYKHYFYVP